jgi:hypothetical protein
MRAIWIPGALFLGLVSAQTQVNVKFQTKDLDLSAAKAVIPFPTGANLPALCTTGSMYFNSAAPAGANLFGCVATNTWAAQAGNGGGTSSTSGLFAAQQSSGVVLTVGGGCSALTPCLVQEGSVVYTFSSPSTVTLTGGSGTVYLYVDDNGTVTAGESAAGAPSLVCSGCAIAASVTQFPPGVVPLAIWSAAGGAWVSGSSEAAVQSGGPAFFAGSNITLTQNGNSVTIAAALKALPTGAQPACSSTTGGFMWYIQSGSGVKDSVQVCAKDAGNIYAWRILY